MICFDMPTMIKFPIILVIAIIFLFFYLGLSFLAGIAVFVIGFIVNFILGMANASLWKKMMDKKDTRMNKTTESLNNIKMIKLYGWNDTFLRKINEKRDDELRSLRTAFIITCLVITCLYLFPTLL